MWLALPVVTAYSLAKLVLALPLVAVASFRVANPCFGLISVSTHVQKDTPKLASIALNAKVHVQLVAMGR